MKRLLPCLLLIPFPLCAQTPGQQGFEAVRRCVMANDSHYCHSILMPDSFPLFDRFYAYKLMPCLPTDFTYENETAADGQRTVKATMPAGGNRHYIIRLVFADTAGGPKLDIPASLKRGMGDTWENKIQLSEQIYLMMKQNMGDKLNCDMLRDLAMPGSGH